MPMLRTKARNGRPRLRSGTAGLVSVRGVSLPALRVNKVLIYDFRDIAAGFQNLAERHKPIAGPKLPGLGRLCCKKVAKLAENANA